MTHMARKKQNAVPHFFADHQGSANPLSMLRLPATVATWLVPTGIILCSVMLCTALSRGANAVLHTPLGGLIGTVAAVAVTRFFGAFAGNLFVSAWLCILYISGQADFASAGATARYGETVVIGFGAVAVAHWASRTQRELSQLQSERSVWGVVAGAVEKRQRQFLRDVLATVTDNRLFLCDAPTDLPAPLPLAPDERPLPLASATLGEVRSRIRKAAGFAGLPGAITGDLVIAGSEAALNAVVHAPGGVAEIRAGETGQVQVWVRDTGKGIDDALLHRATLEAGFSSKGTLGQGFSLMVSTCHRVYLLTGSTGTVVVLETAPRNPV